MKMGKQTNILKDTWHLNNVLHNYLIDYEEILISKGFDPQIIKDLRAKTEELNKEL